MVVFFAAFWVNAQKREIEWLMGAKSLRLIKTPKNAVNLSKILLQIVILWFN
jgi:hypothetical protein